MPGRQLLVTDSRGLTTRTQKDTNVPPIVLPFAHTAVFQSMKSRARIFQLIGKTTQIGRGSVAVGPTESPGVHHGCLRPLLDMASCIWLQPSLFSNELIIILFF